MAYRIEFSLCRGDRFYAEFQIADGTSSGTPLAGGSVSHVFSIFAGDAGFDDYGERGCDAASPVIEANAANGMLSEVDPGLIVVSIPASALAPWCCGPCGVLAFQFSATRADPALTSVIATGTIAIGSMR